MISAVLVRRLVMAVSVIGIAGMIVGSVADNNGTAVTFGIITAVAVLGLILATAVGGTTADQPARITDEAAAEQLEHDIQHLVADGADEAALRQLVRVAIHLGRRSGRPT